MEVNLNKKIKLVHNVFEREVRYGRNSKMFKWISKRFRDIQCKITKLSLECYRKGFFVTHEKLEEYYDEIREQIDEIAEHILSLGHQPLGTIKDFLNHSEIQEAQNEKIKSLQIIEVLIQDIQILDKKAHQIKQEAEKNSWYATSAMIDNYLSNYSKKLWMLNEMLK